MRVAQRIRSEVDVADSESEVGEEGQQADPRRRRRVELGDVSGYLRDAVAVGLEEIVILADRPRELLRDRG